MRIGHIEIHPPMTISGWSGGAASQILEKGRMTKSNRTRHLILSEYTSQVPYQRFRTPVYFGMLEYIVQIVDAERFKCSK